MAATMSDVARLAGVSKKTVSNYFNGYPYMRPDTRTRIEGAIAELNYKLNVSARNLKSGRTGTIALAVPELAHPYFAELAQSIVAVAQERGLSVVVEVTNGDRDREREILESARGRSVDGLIFDPIALSPADVAGATVDVPLILIGDQAHAGLFDFVSVANEEGAYEATAHLLGLGRRRIVALGIDDHTSPTAAAQRLDGYLRALAEHGLEPDDELLIGPLPWRRPAGADAIAALIERGVEFDAVFGFNDALALGALRALHGRGREVPSDVAVIGFDDVEEAEYASPTLSTIASGRDWVARTAVDRLAERIAGEVDDAPRTWVAGHRLIVRESTAR